MSDCWSLSGQVSLSFLCQKRPPDGYVWCVEVWTRIGEAAQNREITCWRTEIYFIHPDDREHSEILKIARELERLVVPDAVQKDGLDSDGGLKQWQ